MSSVESHQDRAGRVESIGPKSPKHAGAAKLKYDGRGQRWKEGEGGEAQGDVEK
jgi:hypothetical protein